MTRAGWKIPIVDIKLCRKKKIIKTYSKESVIYPSFVGRIFEVYNGKIFKKVLIKEEMIGHKLGEFLFTRPFLYKMRKKKKRTG